MHTKKNKNLTEQYEGINSTTPIKYNYANLFPC